MKKYILMLILSLIVLLGCESRREIPTVRLGHAPHDHHAPLYIAAVKEEYFRETGKPYLKKVSYKNSYKLMIDEKVLANVEIDSGTGGIQLIRKLDEKILDVSFGGVPAMISMIDKGSKIKIIAPVMSEGASLVVAKDMPVSDWAGFVKYVKEQKEPVKIGYKVDVSVQNLIFETALSAEKLSFSKNIASEDVDVIVINLHGPNNLLPSLTAGVIDGYVVMQPYPAIAEETGEAKVISQLSNLPPDGQWKGHPCCALAAGTEFIEDHGDIVQAFVDLFERAGKFIISNPDESAKITAEWLLTSESVERRSLPTIKFLSHYTDEWNRGVDLWVKSLNARGGLTGEVKKGVETSTVGDVLYDNRFYNKLEE